LPPFAIRWRVTRSGAINNGIVEYRARGGLVCADITCFESAPRIARPGDNTSSTWAFGACGFPFEQVSRLGQHNCNNPRVLGDTPEKLALGITALQNPAIAQRFPRSDEEAIAAELGIEPTTLRDKFMASHMRRGDYLNVSTRVLPDTLFLRAATCLAEISSTTIIFSDSKLSAGTRGKFEALLPELNVFDSDRLDPFLIHQAIRHASIFVGSNSQFSLVSGLLGNGVYLNPRNWFGREALDEIPNKLGDFNFVC